MDIQERVLNAFAQEHREHLEGIRGILAGWPAIAREGLEEAFRMAHSIKGGARVCDLGTVEKLAHYLEHLFDGLTRGETDLRPGQNHSIEEVLGAIEDYMIAVAEKRTPAEPTELLTRIEPLLPPSQRHEPPAKARLAPAPPQEIAEAPLPPVNSPKSETLRVGAAQLDRLLQSSDLLLAEAVRQDEVQRELRKLAASIEAVQRDCEAEVAAYDLSHSQASSAARAALDDKRRRLAEASRKIRQIRILQEQGMRAMRGMGEQLQNDVRHARMVPINSVFEGFPKMVRDLARAEGKRVEFTALGLDGEADRLVLQGLKDSVMHALRNAIHHGIETPEERRAADKPEAGRIRVEVEIVGNTLRLRISDDGRGLNAEKIRQQAVARGLIPAREAKELDEDELLDLLFRPGFSTAPVVTSVSGRGVGLSVVKEAAVRLQGSVAMAALPSGGSLLTISTPLSIATHRLLLVRSGEREYVIPSGAIEGLYRFPVSEARTAEGHSVLFFEDEPVLLATPDAVFGAQSRVLSTDRGQIHVVLLNMAGRRLALCVDALVRELNAMVKPLPPPASDSPFFSGGVTLENGSIALVLNVSTLIEHFKGKQLEEPEKKAGEAKPLVERRATILVVDDSFTARTLQKSILETEGYTVLIAVDGEQALSVLRANPVDAVVTDVQMPRLDGFQLLEAMKRDKRLKEVPVILVTSLSSEEDQARGLALGADAYIVKQKFDHRQLLDAVQQIV